MLEGQGMKNLLDEAKKHYWRAGLQVTPEYLDSLEKLLLEKLADLGEITEGDRQWTTDTVNDTFPGVRSWCRR